MIVRSASALRYIDEKVPGISIPAGDDRAGRARGRPAGGCLRGRLRARRARACAARGRRPAPDQLPQGRGHRGALPRLGNPDDERRGRRVETVIQSRSRTVVIGPEQPFCIIGERINPTGRKAFQALLQAGDLSQLEIDVPEQVAGGADMLDVNVGDPLADEVALMGAGGPDRAGPDRPAALPRLVGDRGARGRAGRLRGQGARQLRHGRGRAPRGDPAARRQARRRRDRPRERRGHPDGARGAPGGGEEDRLRRRRLRDPAGGRRHRRARDARRRAAERGPALRRDAGADPRAPRRQHDLRRLEHGFRPAAAARRSAARSSRSRRATG